MPAAAILPAVVTVGGAGRGITGSGVARGRRGVRCVRRAVPADRAGCRAFRRRPAASPKPARLPGMSGTRERGPYHTPVLWRIHGASTLLVVPQFVVTGFTLEYLVSQRGWGAADGQPGDRRDQLRWRADQDRRGEVVRPGEQQAAPDAPARDRHRGRRRAGRARRLVAVPARRRRAARGDGAGRQHQRARVHRGAEARRDVLGPPGARRAETAQNIAAAATPPALAQLIQLAGYPASFGITALFPLAAAVAIPASARAVPAR